MERLSDKAIDIINELHTDRLDYTSEYLPLIDASDRLAAYEDTGLVPEEINTMQSYKLLDEHERGKLFEYQNLGCTIDRLREQEERRWIPVTERLPECGEHYESNDVLVSVDYRPDDPEETKDTFVSIDHVCFNCFEQGVFSIERDNPYDTEPSPYFVTHWLPLPEPYKGEHDD